jgi:hypothetical protein
LNIIEAACDPNLFVPLFKDEQTWSGWRTFLKVLFGIPLNGGESQLFRECTGRETPLKGGHSEAWLVIGRRGGKSFVLALIAVFLASFRDWRPFLGPGEVATIMVIAQDRRQARHIMRYVKGLLGGVPILARAVRAETRETITLTNQVVIEIHSASFRSTRGYTIVAALLDELAFWPTDNAADPDYEVINAIPWDGDDSGRDAAVRILALRAQGRALGRASQAFRQGRRSGSCMAREHAAHEPDRAATLDR